MRRLTNSDWKVSGGGSGVSGDQREEVVDMMAIDAVDMMTVPGILFFSLR